MPLGLICFLGAVGFGVLALIEFAAYLRRRKQRNADRRELRREAQSHE